MIKNYLLVAFRNITKYSFYSLINIAGMTIGLTACLLIFLYVSDELSYDRFHHDADRLYQICLHGRVADQDIHTITTCPPLGPTLVKEVPKVESSCRIVPYYNEPVVRYKSNVFTETEVIYADSNFFQFFAFRLISGDPIHCLEKANSVILTEKMAIKYFGDESPVGKQLTIEGPDKIFTVTGVIENTPSNSHLEYSLILSSASNPRLREKIWLNNWTYTYVKLRDNAFVDEVEKKMKEMVFRYVGPEMEKFRGMAMRAAGTEGNEFTYYLLPVIDIHLRSSTVDSIRPHGNILHVYFFSGIGIFILIIACINFMNLATARSAGRAKEVGLRKTLGSFRSQLIGQYLTESILFSFVAVLLSVMICFTLLPTFNLFTGKDLSLQTLMQPHVIFLLIGLIVVVGLISGSYPAFYLTSFSPTEVLKGTVRTGSRSKNIRSALVVFQFFLSMLLIIFTSVIYQQVQFMNDQNLGLDRHNVLMIENTSRLGSNKVAFREAINQQKGIVKSSFTTSSFPRVNTTTLFKSVSLEDDHIMSMYYADYDYFSLMKFELSEGRYFSSGIKSDTMSIVLNEAAVREFGFARPLGEELIFNDNDLNEHLKVVGVVKDYNFESFKNSVRPLAIRLGINGNNLLVRYEGDTKDVVAGAEKTWKKLAPDQPFEYTFLDARFDEMFRVEQLMGDIFTIFSWLAILIACLGLFALSAFTAEQRTKEIGIRKALGASVVTLTLLLAREFTKLVAFAFIPATMIGWYVSEQWLSGFAHRIEIHPLIFVFNGIVSIFIAWITVGYQAIKAASANPVQSLRYE